MTDNNGHDKEYWEVRINALLDGELEAEESEDLKQAATNDQALARNIVEAYQLQRAMEHLQVEKAPASLRRKLKKIPAQNRPAILQPRWAMAFAAVPLVVIAVALMRTQEPPVTQTQVTDPELVKLEKARQDLAVAFAYIDQVGNRTTRLIESEVGGELSDAVAGSIFETIQHQKIL